MQRTNQDSTAWWLVAVQAMGVVLTSGLLLLLLSGVSAAELATRLAAAGPAEAPVRLTPLRYDLLRLGLGSALLAGLLVLAVAGRHSAWWRWRGSQRAGPPPPPRRARWWQLPALTLVQRRGAYLLVALVAGLHGWLAVYDPLSLDEAISYDWFMATGPVVAATYYPFPNNHVLLSLLGAGLQQLFSLASPLVVLRLLPTLVGLGIVVASYQLLLRALRFGPATLAWAAFNLSPVTLTATVAGRGYCFVLAALLAGLWASFRLLRPTGLARRERRWAWLVVGLSGAAGLYAVPTHLYGLLGVLLSLGVGVAGLGRRRVRLNVLYLAIVVVGLGVVVSVLYAPIIAVTSWAALAHNGYVQPVATQELWRQLTGGYLTALAGVLLGWPALSGGLFVGVALVAPVLLVRGPLPAPARRLGWLAYGQLVGWLGFMQVHHVLPPARTLLAVPFFLFLLGALLVQAAQARWPRLAAAQVLVGGLLLLGAVNSYRLGHYLVATAIPRRRSLEDFRRTYEWLRARQPRRVYLESLPVQVYLQHEAIRTGRPPLPLVRVTQVASVVAAEGAYAVVVRLPANQPAVYRIGEVAIVLASGASTPGQSATSATPASSPPR